MQNRIEAVYQVELPQTLSGILLTGINIFKTIVMLKQHFLQHTTY